MSETLLGKFQVMFIFLLYLKNRVLTLFVITSLQAEDKIYFTHSKKSAFFLDNRDIAKGWRRIWLDEGWIY